MTTQLPADETPDTATSSPQKTSGIPGFRTKQWWKMIIAIIGYLFIALMFIGATVGEASARDKIIDGLLVIAIIVPIFIIATNLQGLRDKLPPKGKRSTWKVIGYLLVAIIVTTIAFGTINNLHTPEYLVVQEQRRVEQAQVSEQKRKATEAKKQEEKYAKQVAALQKGEDKAKAEADKKARVEALRASQAAASEATSQQREEADIANKAKTEQERAAKDAERATANASKQADKDQKRVEAETAKSRTVANQKNSTTAATNKPEEAGIFRNGNLVLMEHHIDSDEFCNYISGTVQNNSRSAYESVQIEYNLFDASGAQVGNSFDLTENLSPGATWKFRAPILEDRASNFKVISITGMPKSLSGFFF